MSTKANKLMLDLSLIMLKCALAELINQNVDELRKECEREYFLLEIHKLKTFKN